MSNERKKICSGGYSDYNTVLRQKWGIFYYRIMQILSISGWVVMNGCHWVAELAT